MADWFRGQPVQHYPAGEEVADGPLATAGWYVDQVCSPWCCRPDGPFPSEGAARRWCVAYADALQAGDAAARGALDAEAKAAREA